MPRLHFGTDGVRGTFGETLTPQFVYTLGKSIANVLGKNQTFLIGRDTRTSGAVLFNAIKDGLESQGAKVKDLGILPTPGVAFFAKKENLPAIVLTASHNPAKDNGVKVFGLGASKIDSDTETKIEEQLSVFMEESLDYTSSEESGAIPNQPSLDYVDYLTEKAHRCDLSGLSVVLDCANGAAFLVAPEIFQILGAQVHAINTESDGVKINDGCGATHLDDLTKAVVSYKADIGFAYDGDADRLIAVDDEGNICDGDSLLCLFALDMQSNSQLNKSTVVATVMSNGALKICLEKHGIDLFETKVGDKHVLATMVENDFSLGGEQSGHIIRTDKELWGDGILNSLLVAAIIKKKKQQNPDLSSNEIFNLFEPLVQLHKKVVVRDKNIAENNTEINNAIERELNGLGPDSRIIIRPSGTEDVVRITVEAHEESIVKKSIAKLSEVVNEVCK